MQKTLRMKARLIIAFIITYFLGIGTAFLIGVRQARTAPHVEEEPIELAENRSEPEQQENTGPENFDEFFTKFSGDSAFQVNRIKFPLEKEGLSDDLMEEEKSKIAKKDWGYIPFFGAQEYYIQISSREEEAETGLRYLEFKGIENGIYVCYEFKLVKNKWYLVKWIDRST